MFGIGTLGHTFYGAAMILKALKLIENMPFSQLITLPDRAILGSGKLCNSAPQAMT